MSAEQLREKLHRIVQLTLDSVEGNSTGDYHEGAEAETERDELIDEIVDQHGSPPEVTSTGPHIEEYREQARAFFKHALDENDWDIDDEPTVAPSDEGAYVQLWRWFPATCRSCDTEDELNPDRLCEDCAASMGDQ